MDQNKIVMHKVIFLDHDGVICLSDQWGSRSKKKVKHYKYKGGSEPTLDCRFDNFDPKAVSTLNSIIEKTGADIVVSSDWRYHATLEEMGEYYTMKCIIKKPIAYTPDLSECTWYLDKDFEWTPGWDLEQSRSIEIQQYLIDHPDITNWVAIDDLNMGNSESWKVWGLSNFVLTPRSREGIKQSGIKKKILEFL